MTGKLFYNYFIRKYKNLNPIKIKWIIIAFAAPLPILLNIYFSTWLHFTMKKIDSIINLATCLKSLLESKEHLLLFFSLCGLSLLIVIAIINLNKESYKSRLITLTPDISTPAPCGQKQHGSARWMNRKEQDFCFSVYQTGDTLQTGGTVVGCQKQKKKEKIYYIGDDVHTLCIGATRSGKSRTVVLETIGLTALGGESMIISDPKNELWSYTNEYLKQQGYDVITIDFKDPKKSTPYNFLQPIIDAVDHDDIPKAIEMTWDLTSTLVGEAKGEKIWTHGEASVIAGAVLSVIYDNKEKQNRVYQNLTNVYYFIAGMSKSINGKTPIEEYAKSLPASHPAKGLFAISEIAPSRTKGSFFTSALTTLRLFTNPLIYSMSYESGFDPANIDKRKTAVFIILPDDRTAYYSLASLLVSQFYSALVSEADKRGGRLEKRVNFILDEAGNFAAIPDFSAKLTVAAGRGIRFNLFIQSLAQLEEKYSKETAAIIQGNCEAWIFLGANDLATLEEVSKKLGNYTISTYSLGNSDGSKNSSSSQNISLMSRVLLTVDEVNRIKRPYTLILSKNNPAILYAPDISKYEFNSLFGMGDAEHNRALRELRENKRKKKIIDNDNIKLWGIWDYYRAKLEQNLKLSAFKGSLKHKENTEEKNET